MALAVPPSVTSGRAAYDKHRKSSGHSSQLDKRSVSMDLISEIGDDEFETTKPDTKIDQSPISKFMKMLHPKTKSDKTKPSGTVNILLMMPASITCQFSVMYLGNFLTKQTLCLL